MLSTTSLTSVCNTREEETQEVETEGSKTVSAGTAVEPVFSPGSGWEMGSDVITLSSLLSRDKKVTAQQKCFVCFSITENKVIVSHNLCLKYSFQLLLLTKIIGIAMIVTTANSFLERGINAILIRHGKRQLFYTSKEIGDKTPWNAFDNNYEQKRTATQL